MFGFFKNKQLQDDLSAVRAELAQLKNQMPDWGGLSGDQWSEFFTSVTASGIAVNSESAKRVSAAYACTRLIAESVSVLPMHVYQRTATGRERVDHDLWWLLNESPFQTITSASFWEWMVSSYLFKKDGVAEIVRDRNGVIKGLMPIPRECVVIKKIGNRLVYLINDGVSQYGRDQDDILHFPGYGFNGVTGESVIAYAARQAIGTALAADNFSGEFFANGAVPSVVIQYPQGVAPTKEQQEFLRQQIDERHTGTGNRHRPLLLVNGGTLNPVTMTAEDAQILETRRFAVIDIARAYGVPPHMIGETSAATSWGSGIEQMSIGYVRFNLNPHLNRIVQEVNRKFWPRSLKYFVDYNRDGLLAGDSKTESEVLGKALGGPGAQGWMTINEVRRLKNLPPLTGEQYDRVAMAGSKTSSGNGDDKKDSSVTD